MSNKKIISLAAGGVALSVIAGYFAFTNSQTLKKEDQNVIANILKSRTFSVGEFGEALNFKTEDYQMLKDQVFNDEFTFQEVEKELLHPLVKQLMKGDNKSFEEFFSKDNAKVFGIDAKPVKLLDERDGIKRLSWNTSSALASTSSSFNDYSQIFSSVEDARFDIKSFFIKIEDREATGLKPKNFVISGYMDLRGQSQNGERRHDSGKIELVVTKSDAGWKISRMVFNDFTTMTSKRAPAFKELTSTAFAENGPAIHLRREAIRRGGYALSLTDINRDGFLDMYVGSAGQSEVWMYDPKISKFNKSAQPGLGNVTMVKTAIFGDFNNDKQEDLFVTSFNPKRDENGKNEDLVLYKNDNGQLSKVIDPAKGLSKLDSYYPMPAAVGDFNNDGLLDIYVGFPGKKDFTFTNLSGHETDGDKSVQGMFLNMGNLKFDGKDMRFMTMAEGSRQSLYPHSSLAVDWNKDKNMDIVVIDDQDNLSPFYINKGDAKFQQVAERIGINDTSNAMSIAAGDFNNDGLIDFALTSVSLHAAQRYENALMNHYHAMDDQYTTGVSGNGIRLFQQAKNGTFEEVTKAAGLEYPGEGAAGVEFLDYNNDGHLDMYLANGLWSGNDRFQDAGYYFVAHKKKVEGTGGILRDRTTSMSSFMSMLIDFRGDIFEPNLKGNNSLSVGGYQRNRLFRNNGNGTFTDVGFMEGVDSISDGYVVALADLNKDGTTDIILRNGDPAQKDYQFPAVQVYKNSMKWEGNSIDLALKNNRGVDAIGVGVTIENKGVTQYRQLISNNGPAQSERALHFGIGKNDSVAKLTIHWASGDKVYTNIKAGRHEFSEITSILTQQ